MFERFLLENVRDESSSRHVYGWCKFKSLDLVDRLLVLKEPNIHITSEMTLGLLIGYTVNRKLSITVMMCTSLVHEGPTGSLENRKDEEEGSVSFFFYKSKRCEEILGEREV